MENGELETREGRQLLQIFRSAISSQASSSALVFVVGVLLRMAQYFYTATDDQLRLAGLPPELTSRLRDDACKLIRARKFSWDDLRCLAQEPLGSRPSLSIDEKRDDLFSYLSDDVRLGLLKDLFSLKVPVNDLPKRPENVLLNGILNRLLYHRDRLPEGKFRSWREVRFMAEADPVFLELTAFDVDGFVKLCQLGHVMPVPLSRATVMQLQLCVDKRKAEWLVKQREVDGSVLLKVARAAAETENLAANQRKKETCFSELTMEDCYRLLQTFSAPSMSLTDAFVDDLVSKAFVSKATAERIVRESVSRAFCSWPDFNERMSKRDDKELRNITALDLDVYFALPAGTNTLWKKGSMRKLFGATRKAVVETVWDYRGNVDFSTGKSRAVLEHEGYDLELDHVIDVQLGELAWRDGPQRIFGDVVCADEFMSETREMFNGVCNLNVTTVSVNRHKGQVVKMWKTDISLGRVKADPDSRVHIRWKEIYTKMQESFDCMFNQTFGTEGKAPGFDRSLMLQRWQDPAINLSRRARYAFLDALHQLLEKMLGNKF